MTAVTERLSVGEISAEARQIQLSRVLMMLFLGVFWGTGWLIGRVCLGVVMGWVSVRRGWRDGYHGFGYQPPQGQPSQ